MLAQRSTKIVRNWFNFCIVESHHIFIQNSFKIARQSIQNSIIFGFNLFKMRSKLVFLNSFKFRALKSTSLGAPWALPSRSQGTPRARRGRSRSSLRTLWTSRVPQEGPGSGFGPKFGRNLGSKFEPEFRVQIWAQSWGTNLASESRAQTWDPIVGSKFGCQMG